MSIERARATHEADQRLARFREASAEIATMYKTLLAEVGDPAVAMELTKTWILSLSYHAHVPPTPPQP